MNFASLKKPSTLLQIRRSDYINDDVDSPVLRPVRTIHFKGRVHYLAC